MFTKKTMTKTKTNGYSVSRSQKKIPKRKFNTWVALHARTDVAECMNAHEEKDDETIWNSAEAKNEKIEGQISDKKLEHRVLSILPGINQPTTPSPRKCTSERRAEISRARPVNRYRPFSVREKGRLESPGPNSGNTITAQTDNMLRLCWRDKIQ